MDHVEVAVVASPLAALAPLYDVDPDADVLLIVPPSQAFKLQEKPHYVNGINGINGDHKPTNGKPSPTQSGLRLKVSSKHLALASRVFKSKLSFGTSDTVRQSDGRVHLQLGKGFGPQAVIIVMNAVHSRGSKVPRTVDIETLAQIALFVDRFQLLDAVEVYAERWISKLENGIPNIYNQDLVRWIYISHVFRHAEIFKAATKTAAAQSSGPIDTLGLPIREKILRKPLPPRHNPTDLTNPPRPHRHHPTDPPQPYPHPPPQHPRHAHLQHRRALPHPPLRLAPPRRTHQVAPRPPPRLAAPRETLPGHQLRRRGRGRTLRSNFAPPAQGGAPAAGGRAVVYAQCELACQGGPAARVGGGWGDLSGHAGCVTGAGVSGWGWCAA